MDSLTGEKLPFVAVEYNKALRLGVATDINGEFVIEDISDVDKIIVSFIGYETKTISRKQIPASRRLDIKLSQQKNELSEVRFVAKENPALRIIRNAIKARERNNPKLYDSYSFKSYSKNILTKFEDTVGSAMDLVNMIEDEDTTIKVKQHLMMAESVSKKYYKKPNQSSEKIIGTRLSGFKHSIYAFASDDIQKFGLYDEVIKMISEYYVTPLASGSDKKYFFILTDTVINGTDTTFAMDYQPVLGANFEGFKGEIHINSNGWAIEYVTAQPLYKGKIDFALKQNYMLVGNKYWFPKKLLMTIYIEELPLLDVPGFVTSKVFIDSAKINIEIPNDTFTNFKRELTEEAAYVDEEFWKVNRKEELDEKEIKTYAFMDSIGDRYKFDIIMHSTRNIVRGFLSFGKVELKMNKFLTFNDFEGWRFGFAAYTNSLFSKKFRFGGYYGYGTRDQLSKYGATFEYYLNRRTSNYFSFNYSYDIVQSGRVNIRYYDIPNFWIHFLRRRLDFKEEKSLMYHNRWSKDFSTSVGVKDFTLTPLSSFQFADDPELRPDRPRQTNFNFSEFYLSARYAYKEKRSANMGQEISIGSDYPILRASYSRGVRGFLNGDYDYNKIEFGVAWKRFIKHFGKINMRLETGLVDGALPISMLFAGKSGHSADFTIATQNLFQTMRFHEFFSDRYASFFINHNFGPLLFRTSWFSPELRLYHAMGIGSLGGRRRNRFRQLKIKTLEKGFFESGVAFNNLLKINFYDFGYLGIGAGVFHRYGPNKRRVERENWAYKFTVIYSIN